MKQIGDYVIVKRGHETYGVRMAGAEEYISNHDTEMKAKSAIKRYQDADKRRSLPARKSAARAALNDFMREEI